MTMLSFDDLYCHADQIPEPVAIAVAGGADRTVIEALRVALDRGWVVPQLAGSEEDIRQTAQAGAMSLDGFTILDTAEPARAAVARVRGGDARLLMKGQISTPSLMKALLDGATGLRTDRMVCQVVLMEVCRDGRRFLLTDTGICLQPTLEQKADVLRSAVAVARALGAVEPRVALMAASETVTEAMPETVEAAELQRRGQAGDFPGCVVRGPLSFDLAYEPAAAVRKNVHADFGIADVMLFPNLLSANLTVKAIAYTAGCRFGGVLCGTTCPVVFMSRADSTETRLNSLALALKLLAGPSRTT